jgi:hypothetical protein
MGEQPMPAIHPSGAVDIGRRRFVGAAAMTIAAAQVATIGAANAEARKLPAIVPGTNNSFGPLKQIDAGVLNVGYAEAGPADGPSSFCCMGGRMTSTATSMSRRYWRRRATGCSCRTCAGAARRASCRTRPYATASRRRLLSIPSLSSTRSK